jgi:hypothetical protein
MQSRLTIAFFLALAAAGGIILYLARDRDAREESPRAAPAIPAPPAAAKDVVAPDDEAGAGTKLDDRAAIVGTVRKAEGGALWRARVRCLLGSELVKETRTNRDGTFRLLGLDPGIVYSIEAWSADCMAERQDEVGVGAPPLAFALKHGARLKGQVLTADVGMPLRSFVVTLTGAEDRAVKFDEADGGAFALEGLTGGDYTIVVASAEYGPSEAVRVALKPGDTVSRNFLLPKKE